MLKTNAGDRDDTELRSPQALRVLAERAKRFAVSVPHVAVRQRIIESALRLEAEAALLEQLRQG